MEWMKLKAGFQIFIYFDVLWTGTIASSHSNTFQKSTWTKCAARTSSAKATPPLPISEEKKMHGFARLTGTPMRINYWHWRDYVGGTKSQNTAHNLGVTSFWLPGFWAFLPPLIYLLKFGNLLEVQASFHSGAYATKWMSVAPCWLGKVNLKLCHILQCRPGWNVIEMRECKKKRALLLIRIGMNLSLTLMGQDSVAWYTWQTSQKYFEFKATKAYPQSAIKHQLHSLVRILSNSNDPWSSSQVSKLCR